MNFLNGWDPDEAIEVESVREEELPENHIGAWRWYLMARFHDEGCPHPFGPPRKLSYAKLGELFRVSKETARTEADRARFLFRFLPDDRVGHGDEGD